jgi:hypothetical protein
VGAGVPGGEVGLAGCALGAGGWEALVWSIGWMGLCDAHHRLVARWPPLLSGGPARVGLRGR